MKITLTPKAFLKKYIFHPLETALVYVLYYSFKLLPVDWSSAIGGHILRLIGPHLKTSKTVAYPNLSLVFPELNDHAKYNVIKDMWENLGRVIGELPHLMDISEDATRIQYQGYDYAYSQVNKTNRKKPLMMVSGHIGNWELLPVLTSSHKIKTTMIYRAPNNKYVDALLRRARHADKYMNLVNKGAKGAKELIKALRANEMIGMLIDQKMNDGLKINFMGTEAMTAAAPAEFALKYKADILFSRSIRLKGAYFKLEISPPFNIDAFIKKHEQKTLKEQALILTQEMQNHLGDWIKENPAQWLWTHRRWTNRGDK